MFNGIETFDVPISIFLRVPLSQTLRESKVICDAVANQFARAQAIAYPKARVKRIRCAAADSQPYDYSKPLTIVRTNNHYPSVNACDVSSALARCVSRTLMPKNRFASG